MKCEECGNYSDKGCSILDLSFSDVTECIFFVYNNRNSISYPKWTNNKSYGIVYNNQNTYQFGYYYEYNEAWLACALGLKLGIFASVNEAKQAVENKVKELFSKFAEVK